MPFAASEAMLVDAEARLGRRLPEPIRRRLIKDNGGEVESRGETWWLFPVRARASVNREVAGEVEWDHPGGAG